jgi:hypothetical protein
MEPIKVQQGSQFHPCSMLSEHLVPKGQPPGQHQEGPLYALPQGGDGTVLLTHNLFVT